MKSHVVCVRWDNGHAMASFGKREQRVRRTALEQNIRPDAGETACRVEPLANHETGVEQEQRIGREVADVDRAAALKLKKVGMGGGKPNGWKPTASETVVSGRRILIHHHVEPDLARHQHTQDSIADFLSETHLQVNIIFGIDKYKRRKYYIDHQRQGCHFQDTAVSKL